MHGTLLFLGWCSQLLPGFQISYKQQIWGTVGPLLAGCLEPLAHCRNVASTSLFYRYYFGRYSSELAQMVPLSYSCSDKLHNFSVTIPRCYKDVYINSFFPRAAILWNSHPIECFPLTFDLKDFKSFTCRLFLNRFRACFNLFVLLFFCNSMPRSGC